MKYIPKKVFIIENDIYIEITYKEFSARKKEDPSYKDRKFILMHGILMEVTLEAYKDYYHEKEHMNYLKRLDKENGLLSLDAFISGGSGIDHIRLYAIGEYGESGNSEILDKLRKCLSLLTSEQQKLIHLHYYDGISEKQIGEIYGITQQAVSKRLVRIRKKLKKLLES